MHAKVGVLLGDDCRPQDQAIIGPRAMHTSTICPPWRLLDSSCQAFHNARHEEKAGEQLHHDSHRETEDPSTRSLVPSTFYPA